MLGPVLVGLGNPGPRYAGTRHNVGFQVAERVVERTGAVLLERHPSYEAWGARLDGERELVILTPRTFMNRSGLAVRTWGERHGLEPERCLVVIDDIDLPLGTLRVRAQGSSGGHRGLVSIEMAFGTQGYPRLRVGVGRDVEGEVIDHVLAPFEESELALARETLDRAAEAALTWAQSGVMAAMNAFNVNPRAARGSEG